MKSFPPGAIGSLNTLLCLGPCELFVASRKFGIERIYYTGKIGMQKYEGGGEYYFMEYAYEPLPSKYCHDRSLRDMNIKPNNYNDWFTFATKHEAETYSRRTCRS